VKLVNIGEQVLDSINTLKYEGTIRIFVSFYFLPKTTTLKNTALMELEYATHQYGTTIRINLWDFNLYTSQSTCLLLDIKTFKLNKLF